LDVSEDQEHKSHSFDTEMNQRRQVESRDYRLWSSNRTSKT